MADDEKQKPMVTQIREKEWQEFLNEANIAGVQHGGKSFPTSKPEFSKDFTVNGNSYTVVGSSSDAVDTIIAHGVQVIDDVMAGDPKKAFGDRTYITDKPIAVKLDGNKNVTAESTDLVDRLVANKGGKAPDRVLGLIPTSKLVTLTEKPSADTEPAAGDLETAQASAKGIMDKAVADLTRAGIGSTTARATRDSGVVSAQK